MPKYILDGHKLPWHLDRVEAWTRGELIPPITMDVAWTTRCLAKGELVLMAGGQLCPIEQVQVGDSVISTVPPFGLSGLGTVKRALQTSPSECIINIEFKGGNLRCTKDHLILTPMGWKRADALKIGDKVARGNFVVAGRDRDSQGFVSQNQAVSYSGEIREDNRFSNGQGSKIRNNKQETDFRGRTITAQSEDGRDVSLGQNEAWANNRLGEGNTSSEIPKDSPSPQEPYVTRAADKASRTDEGQQSNAISRGGKEGCRNKTQNWCLQTICTTDGRIAPNGENTSSCYDSRRAQEGKPAHEGKQSYEESRSFQPCESYQIMAQLFQSQGDGRGLDTSGVSSKQSRDTLRETHSTLGVPFCRRWQFLDRPLPEWALPESRFYLQEWAKQISHSPEWGILASSQGQERPRGMGRLQNTGMANIGYLGKRVSDPSRRYQQNHSLVEWVEIKSIKGAGFSDVYDLEIWPHHNFIASGIVVHNCNAHCSFCAAAYQTGQRASIPTDRIKMLLEDAAEMGVRGMVTMSDGESTLHPFWAESIRMGNYLGMDMAAASNGFLLVPELADKVLPHLTYLRINFSAGEPTRYSEIMGVPVSWFHRVADNIRYMVQQKRKLGLAVTINMNMVLHPKNADQILPFARLGKELGVDYAIIKHCLDYKGGPLGVDYAEYEKLQPLIAEAEALSTPDYLVTAKHHMMTAGAVPSCERCYGPSFLLQVSGTGLLAACGPLFGPQYKEKYHIGNICETRLKDLWVSPRYKEVMDYLRSDDFVKTRVCRNYLCVQRHLNEALSAHLKGNRIQAGDEPPMHVSFV